MGFAVSESTIKKAIIETAIIVFIPYAEHIGDTYQFIYKKTHDFTDITAFSLGCRKLDKSGGTGYLKLSWDGSQIVLRDTTTDGQHWFGRGVWPAGKREIGQLQIEIKNSGALNDTYVYDLGMWQDDSL